MLGWVACHEPWEVRSGDVADHLFVPGTIYIFPLSLWLGGHGLMI